MGRSLAASAAPGDVVTMNRDAMDGDAATPMSGAALVGGASLVGDLRAFARASAKRRPGQYWRSERHQGHALDATRHERP
jgi:hypothetical protein